MAAAFPIKEKNECKFTKKVCSNSSEVYKQTITTHIDLML